ncbi:MAG: phosphoglucomutase/phosphomannomutase family protein [Terriglobia bacterium]
MSAIKFGTDGWRGVIAQDFTFANVEIVTQAIADYLETQQPVRREVLIGFDARFMAGRFARCVAEVLAANHYQTELLDRPFPTPYVSYETKRRQLAGGVMVTASHNPAEFLGIKFKAPFGGSATPDVVRQIESALFQTAPRKLSGGRASTEIRLVSPGREYFTHLKSLINFDTIRKAKLKVLFDSMHGNGLRLLEEILREYGIASRTIRSNPDPLFGGVFPEPMPENLGPLKTAILEDQADLGLATDGDADRLGVMDHQGGYVNTHQVLCLLIHHLVQKRKWTGKVVRTFSQSVLVAKICRKLGLALETIPIGFKNIADVMLREDVLIGGEESGGVGIKNHIPERDGILLNLMMLEAVAESGKTLRDMVLDLWKEYGEFHFQRNDLHVPLPVGQELVRQLCDSPPRQYSGLTLERVDTLDGTKLVFEDESWILFRQSGTEPLLRIYCEAKTEKQVDQMMAEGRRLAQVE